MRLPSCTRCPLPVYKAGYCAIHFAETVRKVVISNTTFTARAPEASAYLPLPSRRGSSFPRTDGRGLPQTDR